MFVSSPLIAFRATAKPVALPGQPHFGTKKFPSIREANALFESELAERGIDAKALWEQWGVWTIASDYNYMRVLYNPKKNKAFDREAFVQWLGDRVPLYKARATAGEPAGKSWITVGAESYCCGNGCQGCRLNGSAETPIGIIKKPRDWPA